MDESSEVATRLLFSLRLHLSYTQTYKHMHKAINTIVTGALLLFSKYINNSDRLFPQQSSTVCLQHKVNYTSWGKVDNDNKTQPTASPV